MREIMKSLKIHYRLFIYLSMVLTICYPSLQLSAAPSIQFQEIHEQSPMIGCLENGLRYTFIPSSKLKGGAFIKLTCSVPPIKEQAEVSLLTQHALFYGTQQYDRQQLANKLDRLGFDIEADSFLQKNESETSFNFGLSDPQPEITRELLGMLNQMLFFPNLKFEAIESARNHLLSQLDQSSLEATLPLQNITHSDLQKFHNQWYRPEHMHLTLVGFKNTQEVLSILSNAFESPVQTSQILPAQEIEDLSNNERMEEFTTDLVERVEWTEDHQSLIVDGKICMNEPNWINKSNNGRTLGVVLTILGLGSLVLAFPFIAPITLIASSLSTATGLYFLTSGYLKDPHYVESARQTDLQKGCAYAYSHHRAGITLTPYERRALFLQEMVDHPQTLPRSPLLLLADLYQLNDPMIAEIFTVDEYNFLTRLKRDFIQQRNQFKLIKEGLEKELAVLISPHVISRDTALTHAQDAYNQNYYVISRYALNAAREESIIEIKKTYENQEISFEERDTMIKQADAYYEACISTPEFKGGLVAAETTLLQTELEIQTAYAYQVELCKQSMQYHQRMEYYKQGESNMRNYFAQELNNLLATFPVYLTILPDYLDLRSL
jgi:hypothetical protein